MEGRSRNLLGLVATLFVALGVQGLIPASDWLGRNMPLWLSYLSIVGGSTIFYCLLRRREERRC